MHVIAKKPDGHPVHLKPHRYADGYGLTFRKNLDVSVMPNGDCVRPLRVKSLEEFEKLAESDLFVLAFSHPEWNEGAVAQFPLDRVALTSNAKN